MLIARGRWEMKPGLKAKKVAAGLLVSAQQAGGVGLY